jgi:hypothetical protein
MTVAAGLDSAIQTVAPIIGVSLGRSDDKSTWRIDFAPEATPEQRDAAAAVVAKFDVVAAESAEQLKTAELGALADEARSDVLFKGLSNATDAEIGDFIDSTFSEMKTDQRAVFKLLLRSTVLRLRVEHPDVVQAVEASAAAETARTAELAKPGVGVS